MRRKAKVRIEGRGFPGGPVVKTPRSQYRGFDPWSGTRSHMLQLRPSVAKLNLKKFKNKGELESPKGCHGESKENQSGVYLSQGLLRKQRPHQSFEPGKFTVNKC